MIIRPETRIESQEDAMMLRNLIQGLITNDFKKILINLAKNEKHLAMDKSLLLGAIQPALAAAFKENVTLKILLSPDDKLKRFLENLQLEKKIERLSFEILTGTEEEAIAFFSGARPFAGVTG